MTEPLIDRHNLTRVIRQNMQHGPHTGSVPEDHADAVLAHLRIVLTPEALNFLCDRVYYHAADGHDLHRRIFGEEPAPPEASKPSRVAWGTRGSASS